MGSTAAVLNVLSVLGKVRDATSGGARSVPTVAAWQPGAGPAAPGTSGLPPGFDVNAAIRERFGFADPNLWMRRMILEGLRKQMLTGGDKEAVTSGNTSPDLRAATERENPAAMGPTYLYDELAPLFGGLDPSSGVQGP